jgi:hypothetical protein
MDDEQQAIERIVNAMTDEQQAHFKTTIAEILRCYEPDGPSAVLILGYEDDPIVGISTINSDVMTSAKLLNGAKDFFNMANMHNAPPKEKFN